MKKRPANATDRLGVPESLMRDVCSRNDYSGITVSNDEIQTFFVEYDRV